MSLYLGDNLVSGSHVCYDTRNIGQIVQSTIPLTDAGLHLLDGGLVLAGGIYDDFVNYIANIYNNTAVVEKVWTQPRLSSNGVVGGNSFAVSSNVTQLSGNDVYNAFDGVTSGGSLFHSQSGTTTGYIIIYNPTPIKITNLKIYNQSNAANRASSAGNIYGSNDGVSWVGIDSYTNSQQSAGGVWNIDLSLNTGYFKYYRLASLSGGSDSYWTINEIEIFAYYKERAGFTTEEDWQASVVNHGVCGKFVYTESSGSAVSVRLPKITGFTEGAIDPTVIGTLTEAGLPNITGKAASTKPGNSNNDPSVSGALYKTGGTNINDTVTNNGNGQDYYTLYLDASRVSSLYKNNFNKVQPQSIKVLYYIVIGTSTKTPVQVDLDEIATDLNGKCDVDGTNATFAHITETYSNGTSWYKVYSNGWCEQGGLTTSISTGGNVTITMLKVFVDTGYNLLISSNGAYYASAEANNTAVKNSSSQITISNGSHVSSQFSWEAKGYIS